MIEAWVILWALWSLTVWYQVNFWLPARKAISGCTHDHGRVRPAVPGPTGRHTALVWHCSACPFQLPLQLVRGADPRHPSFTDTWLRPADVEKDKT